MRRKTANLLAVWTRGAHALLRAPHLGGGNHLHGARDLARVFHAADFCADFLRACHGMECLWIASTRPQPVDWFQAPEGASMAHAMASSKARSSTGLRKKHRAPSCRARRRDSSSSRADTTMMFNVLPRALSRS